MLPYQSKWEYLHSRNRFGGLFRFNFAAEDNAANIVGGSADEFNLLWDRTEASFISSVNRCCVRPGNIGIECNQICIQLPRPLLASISTRYARQAVCGSPLTTPEICIDHLRPRTICVLLNYAINRVAPKSVDLELLKAAEMFEIVDLKELCERAVSKRLTIMNALEYLEASYALDANILKRNTMEFIMVNRKRLQWSLDVLPLQSLPWTKEIHIWLSRPELICNGVKITRETKRFFAIRFGFIGIECNGVCFELPRKRLAAISPRYRQQALTGEKRTIPEICLNHLDPGTICDLLNFALNGAPPLLFDRDLLIAAEMFQVADLKEHCERELCTNVVGRNVMELLQLSYELDASILKRHLLRFIVSNRQDLPEQIEVVLRNQCYWTKDLATLLE